MERSSAAEMPKSSIMARGIARAETVVSEEATEGSLIQASRGISSGRVASWVRSPLSWT
jgi:hypothetical protein